MDVAGRMKSIRRAAAGAVQSCPAVVTVMSCVDIAQLELITKLCVRHAVPDVAELKGGITDKLMTRVKISPCRHRHVFRSGAAARNSLVDAGTMLQIDHVMIEGDRLSFLLSANHILRQELVLLVQDRQILFGQRARARRLTDHRLHGKLRKAKIVRHMEEILREVRIEMREGPAHVIIAVASLLYEFLELRHDGVIASPSELVHTETVIDLLASIQRQDDIVAFLIRPLDDLIVHIHAVCGQRKAEVLVLLLLDAAGIGNQLLADLKVHKWLPAEEVHLKIPAESGILNKEIQCTLSRLKAHQPLLPLEGSLRSKAVRAIQIAGVRHQKAKCLNHIRTVFQIKGLVLKDILCEKLPVLNQLIDIRKGICHVLHCEAAVPVSLHQLSADGLPVLSCIKACNRIIGHLIRHMNRTGIGIQNNVVSVQFILMNHFVPLTSTKGRNIRRCSGPITAFFIGSVVLVLAVLICDAAAGLACALAGSLALAAAAVLSALNHITCIQSHNVLHCNILHVV